MCTELPASAEECHLKKTFHEKRRTSHFIMNCVCFFWYPEIFNIKRYDGDNKEFRGSKLGYLKGHNSYLHPWLCLEQNYESDTKKTQ